MRSLTLVPFRPFTTWIDWSSGLSETTGNVSPVRPITMST
jgi:hypothetical protein